MKQFIVLDAFQKDTISDTYEGKNLEVRISDLAEVCKRIAIYDEAIKSEMLVDSGVFGYWCAYLLVALQSVLSEETIAFKTDMNLENIILELHLQNKGGIQ